VELAMPGSAHTVPITTAEATVKVRRRTVDQLLIASGTLVTIVLLVAGGLLTWGNHFATDYVHKELSSQHVRFPDAAALTAEGRADLVGHAGDAVTSGADAHAYAGYIAGHLDKIGGGSTYADLSAPQSAATAAVQAAKAAGAPAAEIATLQAKADSITSQRDTLFKGETLRGLLLTTYAWSIVGEIAGIAAIAAFAGAAGLGALVVAGLVHLRRAPKS
jgi:hypothetical protein